MKKVFLQTSQNSQENICARVSSFFPVNFPKFVRPLFLQNTFGRLLLYLEPCKISMIELFGGNTEAVAERCSLKRCS